MGLDNGITIRKIKKEDIPSFVKYEDYSSTDETKIEIAYWRKCWGIRQAIADVLHSYTNTAGEYADADIDREDIPALVETLVPFLGKDYWNEYADSIWEYEAQIANTRQILINLLWLYTYMADHDIEVHFYDSY